MVLCIQAVLLLVAATGVLFLLFMPKFFSILSDERLSINDFHRRYRMRSKSGDLKSTEITNTGTKLTKIFTTAKKVLKLKFLTGQNFTIIKFYY